MTPARCYALALVALLMLIGIPLADIPAIVTSILPDAGSVQGD